MFVFPVLFPVTGLSFYRIISTTSVHLSLVNLRLKTSDLLPNKFVHFSDALRSHITWCRTHHAVSVHTLSSTWPCTHRTPIQRTYFGLSVSEIVHRIVRRANYSFVSIFGALNNVVAQTRSDAVLPVRLCLNGRLLQLLLSLTRGALGWVLGTSIH